MRGLTVQQPDAQGFGLAGSGMFVINPPHTLHGRTAAALLPWLAQVLGQHAGAAHLLQQQRCPGTATRGHAAVSVSARVRVLPFVAFMLLLMLRGWLPPDGAWGIDPRWIYGLSVLVVGGMLIALAQEYGELARQTLPDARESLWAVGVGLAVFVLWIQLDAPWMTLGEATRQLPAAERRRRHRLAAGRGALGRRGAAWCR